MQLLTSVLQIAFAVQFSIHPTLFQYEMMTLGSVTVARELRGLAMDTNRLVISPHGATRCSWLAQSAGSDVSSLYSVAGMAPPASTKRCHAVCTTA